MKTVCVLITILLFFGSCATKHKEPKEKPDVAGYSKRTFKLINGLGTISLYLPNELDTLYSNIYNTDISLIKRNVASSKKYPIINNSGEWGGYPDSMYYFQIIYYLDSTKTIGNANDSIYLKERLNTSDVEKGGNIDSFSRINNKLFLITDKSKLMQDSSKYTYVNGNTVINERNVTLQFLYKGRRVLDLKQKMSLALKTIEIIPDSKK